MTLPVASELLNGWTAKVVQIRKNSMAVRLEASNSSSVQILPRRCSSGKITTFERDTDMNDGWESIDFSAIDYTFQISISRDQKEFGRLSVDFMEYTRRQVKIRDVLCELDLSSLQWLENCFIKGCRALQKASLPPCVEALNAASCDMLATILLPFGINASLRALNLSHCESLALPSECDDDHPYAMTNILGQSTRKKIFETVRELDLSYSSEIMSNDDILETLKGAKRLELLVLDGIADDEIISALCDSEAAKETLRFVSVQDSVEVTAAACEALVHASPMLRRLRLFRCEDLDDDVVARITGILAARRDRRNGNNKQKTLHDFWGKSA